MCDANSSESLANAGGAVGKHTGHLSRSSRGLSSVCRSRRAFKRARLRSTSPLGGGSRWHEGLPGHPRRVQCRWTCQGLGPRAGGKPDSLAKGLAESATMDARGRHGCDTVAPTRGPVRATQAGEAKLGAKSIKVDIPIRAVNLGGRSRRTRSRTSGPANRTTGFRTPPSR